MGGLHIPVFQRQFTKTAQSSNLFVSYIILLGFTSIFGLVGMYFIMTTEPDNEEEETSHVTTDSRSGYQSINGHNEEEEIGHVAARDRLGYQSINGHNEEEEIGHVAARDRLGYQSINIDEEEEH